LLQARLLWRRHTRYGDIMRTIQDENGHIWDVAVAAASYGMHYLVFAVRGERDIRQVPMIASTLFDAERELAALTEEELRTRLANAEPRD
jgi:hypothetical protein